MFQMEQIPGDFCADNLALILKAKGVSVLAEHLQLFTTSARNERLKIEKIKAGAIYLHKLFQAHSSATTRLSRIRNSKVPGHHCTMCRTECCQIRNNIQKWTEHRMQNGRAAQITEVFELIKVQNVRSWESHYKI